MQHWLDSKLEPVDRCYTTFAEIMNKSGNYYIRGQVSFPRRDEVLDASDLGFATTNDTKTTKGDWDPRWMRPHWLSCRLAFFGQDLQD